VIHDLTFSLNWISDIVAATGDGGFPESAFSEWQDPQFPSAWQTSHLVIAKSNSKKIHKEQEVYTG